MSSLRFDNKVAIITGAGGGLGRSHALLLGSRGAKVVVNDLGGTATGGGKSSAAADKVVEEIKAAGGTAIANYDSVEDGDKIIKTAIDAFGGVDILVNNAGILRDTSFQKLSAEDWDLIYRVHVLGAYRTTKAVWDHMRDKGYGRIIFTSSAAGIYGNFGQSNYSMAKLGLLGFSNTLAIEGKKKNVHVNTIAPLAGSRLTETVLPKELIDALRPEYVSPLVAYLCHEECKETGGLFEVGGGFFAKLRWERSAGEMLRLGGTMTPEMVKRSWGKITGWEKASHPPDITASMQPILQNLQAGPTKGGNEFIDVDVALGYEFSPMTSKYDERDVSLYALGIGAAHNPLDANDLQLVYEMHGEGFRTFPTFGVIPAIGCMMERAKQGEQAPGMNYGFDRILHGEHTMEIKRPLPPKATLTHKAKITNIYDKGKNALVLTEVKSYDEAGNELIVNEFVTLVRGAGGWGGDRGPTADVNVPPERAPDQVVTEKILENQALLYRLTGDINPLHADPMFATAFGFQKPILHGLCTYGFATRHVVNAFHKGDPRKFKSVKARFADSVFPGETLITEMWKDGDDKVIFRCKVKERDKVVISNAAVEFYKEIPKAIAAKPAAAPAAAAGAPAKPSTPTEADVISADIFRAIELYLEATPDLAAKIQTVFQFKLTGPDSAWSLDLKSGKGSIKPGTAAADVTLEMTDSDFIAMSTGKADAQKLYFGGKMKIGGNVMASQKLQFLQKMDPAYGVKAVTERFAKGGGNAPAAAAPAAAPATTATPASSADVVSGDIFRAIALYLEATPDLAAKIQTIFQFKLAGPDSAWLLDLKNGKGSIKPGTGTADVTLEMADSDFIAMSTGKADAQKLYFGGKMKIGGNVMASQKLQFLQKMDPEYGVKAVKERLAGGGGHAAASAAAASSASAGPVANASSFFAKLKERLTQNANLSGEVGVILQFKVKSPDALFSVDLKASPGVVKEGAGAGAVATFILDDSDLAALAKGEVEIRSLYQHGRLRVDGDAHYVHKLGFLKGLV